MPIPHLRAKSRIVVFIRPRCGLTNKNEATPLVADSFCFHYGTLAFPLAVSTLFGSTLKMARPFTAGFAVRPFRAPQVTAEHLFRPTWTGITGSKGNWIFDLTAKLAVQTNRRNRCWLKRSVRPHGHVLCFTISQTNLAMVKTKAPSKAFTAKLRQS